jgi:hypothetical protein
MRAIDEDRAAPSYIVVTSRSSPGEGVAESVQVDHRGWYWEVEEDESRDRAADALRPRDSDKLHTVKGIGTKTSALLQNLAPGRAKLPRA